MIVKSIQFLDPSRTFPIEMNPEIFGHDEDLYIALEDIIHLSSMVEIGAQCVALYIRLAIFSLFTLHAQNNILFLSNLLKIPLVLYVLLLNTTIEFRILHRKLEKSKREQYFRFFDPTWASVMGSSQMERAQLIAECLKEIEIGQFWLLPVNIRYYFVNR